MKAWASKNRYFRHHEYNRHIWDISFRPSLYFRLAIKLYVTQTFLNCTDAFLAGIQTGVTVTHTHSCADSGQGERIRWKQCCVKGKARFWHVTPLVLPVQSPALESGFHDILILTRQQFTAIRHRSYTVYTGVRHTADCIIWPELNCEDLVCIWTKKRPLLYCILWMMWTQMWVSLRWHS